MLSCFRENLTNQFFLELVISEMAERIKTQFSTNITQVSENICGNFRSIISILDGKIAKIRFSVVFLEKSNFCHNFFFTQTIATKLTLDLDFDKIHIVARFGAPTRGVSALARWTR